MKQKPTSNFWLNTSTNRTIVSEIPPIEMGRKGGEEYEEAVIQRSNINKTIRAAFKHIVRLTDVNIKQCEEGTILDDKRLSRDRTRRRNHTGSWPNRHHCQRSHQETPAWSQNTEEKTQMDTQATPSQKPSQPHQEKPQTSETTTHDIPEGTWDKTTQTLTIPPGITGTRFVCQWIMLLHYTNVLLVHNEWFPNFAEQSAQFLLLHSYILSNYIIEGTEPNTSRLSPDIR